MSVHQSVFPSVCFSIRLSFSFFICLSISLCLSICLSACLSLSFRLSICLPICLSTHLPVFISVCQFSRLSVRPPIRPSIFTSNVCTSFVCPSVCPPQRPHPGSFYFYQLGNCNFDFLNFCHRQVWNFKILNLYKWNQNFGVIFQKYQKRNWKSTKYFATSRKPCVLPLKFCEMSIVLWNPINYCKISQFLIKFCKSLNNLRIVKMNWKNSKILP
jgi:hypothetical protein